MECTSNNTQTSPRTPPRTRKNSSPHTQVPPPPSKRRTQCTPGSSPAIGKTQSLSYYLEATANGELDEWEAITTGLCAVEPDSGSPARATTISVPAVPETTSTVSSNSKQTVPCARSLTNAQLAAQIAQEQSLHKPSAEVFLNLYEAMHTSLVADFQKQYENYQIIIGGYQHSSMVKLEDALQQNAKLRERLVTLEKMRGEERGYWEAEKKHLILRLEKGEDRLDREEILGREAEDRRKERDEHDKAMRRIVEKYEAKKKLWAHEKEEFEKEKGSLLSRATELDEENRRLEDIITNDDNVLLEQLEGLENEKTELIAGFDQERGRWEVERASLRQDLALARQTVERLKKERGTLYSDTKKTLTDVQRENETLNETVGELTRRIEWQQKIWEKEKSVIMARLQEERNDVATLRQRLYKKETKRKREGVQEEDEDEDEDEELFLHQKKPKKSRIEIMVGPEEEQDERDEVGLKINHIEEGFKQQEREVDTRGLDDEAEYRRKEHLEEESGESEGESSDE